MDTLLESEFVPLIEKAIGADGILPVLIISPGWGSAGYYSPKVLQESAIRYRAGTHMFLDHPTAAEEKARPERSLQDLAGVLSTDARWDPNGIRGPGLYATAKVFTPYRDLISEVGPHIGLSHRARGSPKKGIAEGRSGPIIESIRIVESVDFVTKAGRGGAILAMMESTRNIPDTNKGMLIERYQLFKGLGLSESAASVAAIGRGGTPSLNPTGSERSALSEGLTEIQKNNFALFRTTGMSEEEARAAAIGRY
ncbi:MAG: hypothetical protein ACYDDV_00385 [Methanoregula sp.]